MVLTIENDPRSPKQRRSGDPPAEWIYRDKQEGIIAQAANAAGMPGLAQARASWGEILSAVPAFPKQPDPATTVAARVNHGRWLWDCPLCGGAQVCTPADPRAFCVECWNGGSDRWWPVLFPEERADIELVLDARPLEQNRNWSPGETVMDLRRENVEHGLPDPLGD